LVLGGITATAAAIAGMLRFDARSAENEANTFEPLFVLYPKFTLLDFAGANEVFARLPTVSVRIASPDGGAITSDTSVVLGETIKLSDVKTCDFICVPGRTDRSTMMRPDVQKRLRRLAVEAKYVASICNASLILGAAGSLKGRRSARHWAQRNLLGRMSRFRTPRVSLRMASRGPASIRARDPAVCGCSARRRATRPSFSAVRS
jgi:cyclohexyl-isocyanide hydratase